MVKVYENYRDYSPPPWVRSTVERLLASLSPSHVGGLSAVVLTDEATAFSRNIPRQRTDRLGRSFGWYYRARGGRQAWIELAVDRIVDSLPKYVAGLQWARDFTVARVLFHEVGHHLDYTVGSAARGGEPAAEDWARKLWRRHHHRKYRHLRLAGPAFLMVIRFLAGLDRAKRVRTRSKAPATAPPGSCGKARKPRTSGD